MYIATYFAYINMCNFYIAHYKIYRFLNFKIFINLHIYFLKTKSTSFEMHYKTTTKIKNYQGS